MAVYRGNQFSQWQGDVFMTSLIFRHIVRVDMDNGKPVGTQELFGEIGDRPRDIRVGPDGALYILSEGEDGKLWRVSKR